MLPSTGSAMVSSGATAPVAESIRDHAEGVCLRLLSDVPVRVGGDSRRRVPENLDAVRTDTAPSASIIDATEWPMMWNRARMLASPARFSARP